MQELCLRSLCLSFSFVPAGLRLIFFILFPGINSWAIFVSPVPRFCFFRLPFHVFMLCHETENVYGYLHELFVFPNHMATSPACSPTLLWWPTILAPLPNLKLNATSVFSRWSTSILHCVTHWHCDSDFSKLTCICPYSCRFCKNQYFSKRLSSNRGRLIQLSANETHALSQLPGSNVTDDDLGINTIFWYPLIS